MDLDLEVNSAIRRKTLEMQKNLEQVSQKVENILTIQNPSYNSGFEAGYEKAVMETQMYLDHLNNDKFSDDPAISQPLLKLLKEIRECGWQVGFNEGACYE